MGLPKYPPAVLIESVGPEAERVRLYSTWNGATEVDAWRITGSDSPLAPRANTLTECSRAGFETACEVWSKYQVGLLSSNLTQGSRTWKLMVVSVLVGAHRGCRRQRDGHRAVRIHQPRHACGIHARQPTSIRSRFRPRREGAASVAFRLNTEVSAVSVLETWLETGADIRVTCF